MKRTFSMIVPAFLAVLPMTAPALGHEGHGPHTPAQGPWHHLVDGPAGLATLVAVCVIGAIALRAHLRRR